METMSNLLMLLGATHSVIKIQILLLKVKSVKQVHIDKTLICVCAIPLGLSESKSKFSSSEEFYMPSLFVKCSRSRVIIPSGSLLKRLVYLF